MTIEEEVMNYLKTKHGIEFNEYYGEALIYGNGGQKEMNNEPSEVRQFFKPYNEGHYTVNIFRIPEKFYTKTLNLEELKKVIDTN